MSNVFWKEFKGWCKAFTKTETCLLIIEAILIVLFLSFLIFVIVHLIVCSNLKFEEKSNDKINNVPFHTEVTEHPKVSKKCTWTPSHKTTPVTQYYVSLSYENQTQSVPSTTTASPAVPLDSSLQQGLSPIKKLPQYVKTPVYDMSDGIEAEEMYKRLVLALVKIRPPRDVTFGCFLTVIGEYWTVTAASCIEAIEEVDSLDSFVMMEGFGDGESGRSHVVADIQVHPSYGGVNRSRDLAALRSETRLLARQQDAVQMASLLDYYMVTIGERFTILGFGRFRTVDLRSEGRRLRAATVWRVGGRWCAGEGGDVWSHRHLVAGGAVSRGAPEWGGRGSLCAGVLRDRPAPCNYCAGTPLLSGALLVGIMADNQQCAVSCEPALYVNIANVKDWLDAVISD